MLILHSIYTPTYPLNALIYLFLQFNHVQIKPITQRRLDICRRTKEIQQHAYILVADAGMVLRGHQLAKFQIVLADSCMQIKEFGAPGGIHPGCPIGSAHAFLRLIAFL